MAPIARSKLPVATSSNHTDSTTVRRLHSTLSVCCSIAWMACDHSLKLATSRTRKSSALDAVRVAGRRHQRLRLLDRGGRIGLIAEPLASSLRRGEFRERVDEAADHHRRHVLDDVDQHRLVEHQMEGAAHPRIVERLLLVVHPGRLDHALVVVGAGHARRRLGLARGHRIERCAHSRRGPTGSPSPAPARTAGRDRTRCRRGRAGPCSSSSGSSPSPRLRSRPGACVLNGPVPGMSTTLRRL